MEDYINVSVLIITTVTMGPGVMDASASSFKSKLPKEFLGLSVVNIQVDVYIPDLRILVGFL